MGDHQRNGPPARGDQSVGDPPRTAGPVAVERDRHGHLIFRVEQMRVMGQGRRAQRRADWGSLMMTTHPEAPDPTPEPEPQPERPGEPEPEPAPETPDEEAL